MSVNPDKTGLAAFKRRRQLLGFFEPHLFDVTLRRSMSVKHLGVVLDSRLTWRENVKVRKAHNLLWACSRRAYGVTWDLRPKVVHWLYVPVIRPYINFASLVWWPGCQTASAKKRLSRIPRLACLGIKGAMRTTPLVLWKHLLVSPHWSY